VRCLQSLLTNGALAQAAMMAAMRWNVTELNGTEQWSKTA
jgi:hypothetical protein